MKQLQGFLAPHGYTVKGVEVAGCLHLKSAVTQVSEDALLLNPAWVDRSIFGEMHFVEVDGSEPSAANAVWVDNTVIYPSSFPRTQHRLEEAGLHVKIVDATEVAKAEGAVTCCSLIFQAR
jgi:dimethylargininase